MVIGAATVILWKQIAVDQYGSGLYEMVPGFFAASVSIVLASLLDRVPVESVRDTHAQVHAALAEHGRRAPNQENCRGSVSRRAWCPVGR